MHVSIKLIYMNKYIHAYICRMHIIIYEHIWTNIQQYTINLGLFSSSCLSFPNAAPLALRQAHWSPATAGPAALAAAWPPAAGLASSSCSARAAPSARKSLPCKPAPPFPPLPLEEPSSSEDQYIESNNLVTVFDAPSASSKVWFERNHSIQESLNLSYASSVSKIDFTCLSIKRRCSMWTFSSRVDLQLNGAR